MQFYLNGYTPGDPDILAAAPGAETRPADLPDTVDVLIVGSGPAGMVLAAQLSTFPGISTRLVERRDGPLQVGQADGVACRTVEMFEAFGLSEKLVREAYWVNETVFWRPSPEDRSRIVRTGRVQDTEDGLSEFPHLIVNQARLQQYLLDYMRKSPTRLEANYGLEFVDPQGRARGRASGRRDADATWPTARRRRSAPSTSSAATARAAGCAIRSAPCRAATSPTTPGASWTCWPSPTSRTSGSRPRSSRPTRATSCSSRARAATWCGSTSTWARSTRTTARPSATYTQEKVIETAQRVLRPYTLDVRSVAWFAVYQVGQRVTDRFDDVPADQAGSRLPRVFIAGDACHTHSAKAGQGMNVSMQDAFNLGWKLASVLEGRAKPELLRTYTVERHAIAQGLIDFDKEWSKIMASPPKDPDHPELGGVDPAELQAYFVKSGRYTAGVATHYAAGDGPDRRGDPPGRSPRASRSACASTRRPSCASPTPSRCSSATPPAPTAPGASTPSPTRADERLRKLADFLAESPTFADPPLHARRAQTSTASSTFARSSSRGIATSRSRSCRRFCFRARDASG